MILLANVAGADSYPDPHGSASFWDAGSGKQKSEMQDPDPSPHQSERLKP
jgi:hypothetical protein